MKIVRQISTQKLVYAQAPDFEKGKGIANAAILEGIPVEDLEEIEAPQAVWEAANPARTDQDSAEDTMTGNAFTRALIKRMARAEDKTPRQLIDEIKAEL